MENIACLAASPAMFTDGTRIKSEILERRASAHPCGKCAAQPQVAFRILHCKSFCDFRMWAWRVPGFRSPADEKRLKEELRAQIVLMLCACPGFLYVPFVGKIFSR